MEKDHAVRVGVARLVQKILDLKTNNITRDREMFYNDIKVNSSGRYNNDKHMYLTRSQNI